MTQFVILNKGFPVLLLILVTCAAPRSETETAPQNTTRPTEIKSNCTPSTDNGQCKNALPSSIPLPVLIPFPANNRHGTTGTSKQADLNKSKTNGTSLPIPVKDCHEERVVGISVIVMIIILAVLIVFIVVKRKNSVLIQKEDKVLNQLYQFDKALGQKDEELIAKLAEKDAEISRIMLEKSSANEEELTNKDNEIFAIMTEKDNLVQKIELLESKMERHENQMSQNFDQLEEINLKKEAELEATLQRKEEEEENLKSILELCKNQLQTISAQHEEEKTIFNQKEHEICSKLAKQEQELSALKSEKDKEIEELSKMTELQESIINNLELQLSNRTNDLTVAKQRQADLESELSQKQEELGLALTHQEDQFLTLSAQYGTAFAQRENEFETKLKTQYDDHLMRLQDTVSQGENEVAKLMQQHDELLIRMVQTEEEKRNLANTLDFMESEVKSRDLKLSNKIDQLEAVTRRKAQVEADFMLKEQTFLNTLTQQQNEFKILLEQKDFEKTNLVTKIQNLESQLADFTSQLNQNTVNQKAATQRNSHLEALLNQKQEEITSLEIDYNNMLKEKDAIISSLNSQIEETTADTDLENLRLEVETVRKVKATLESKYEEISDRYALLLGHHNHHQKIHHLENLKDENLGLTKAVLELRQKLSKCQAENLKLRENKFDRSQAFKHSSKESTSSPSGQSNDHGATMNHTFVLSKK